jgi:hypothetical protein
LEANGSWHIVTREKEGGRDGKRGRMEEGLADLVLSRTGMLSTRNGIVARALPVDELCWKLGMAVLQARERKGTGQCKRSRLEHHNEFERWTINAKKLTFSSLASNVPAR